MVRLMVHPFFNTRLNQYYFNSSMVRLMEIPVHRLIRKLQNFNSSMVRLMVRGYFIEFFKVKFQFLYGAINGLHRKT